MKRLLLAFSILLATIFVVSCTGGDAASPAGGGAGGNNAPKLDPNKIDLSKPIPVAELKEAVFAWDGQEVTVVGYVRFPKITNSVDLRGSADADKVLISCNLPNPSNEEAPKDVPVVIKGTVAGTYLDDRIKLDKCELVSKGEPAAKAASANPKQIDLSKPIPAEALYQSFFAWEGKELTVIGNYHSTTTSTTSYGKTIRVDLTDPQTQKKMVGCNMKAEHPQVNERNGKIVKGTVKGRTFDQVKMENCEFVN